MKKHTPGGALSRVRRNVCVHDKNYKSDAFWVISVHSDAADGNASWNLITCAVCFLLLKRFAHTDTHTALTCTVVCCHKAEAHWRVTKSLLICICFIKPQLYTHIHTPSVCVCVCMGAQSCIYSYM